MKWLNLTVAAAVVGSILLPAGVAWGETRDPAESELWTDAAVRLKTPLGVDATLTQHLRWNDGISRLNLVAPELALRHKTRSWLHFEAGYRYKHERDNDGLFQDRHRVFAGSRLRVATRPANLDLRVQWQQEFRAEEDDGTPRRQVLRLRAKAKLRRTGPFRPYAAVETFHRLDGADPDIPDGTLTALRWTLGVEWQRGSREYDLHYHLVSPTHDQEKAIRHVVSVGIRFDI
ncbi:MAG: DUF2490 domain-containing protein [bacterium]|nr:DUF2490 domain-containing protein [bacterium]